MAVRVKLLISSDDKELEGIALVNSGFETETSQLLLPIAAAEKLGLWPPLKAIEATYDTAGGPTRVWVYPKKVKVKVIVENTSSNEVKADIVISSIENEILISDKLAGSLKIVVEDFGKGLWRLRKEKRLHETEEPQIWK